MTAPAIDLTRYHFKNEIGEFIIYGTWLHTQDSLNQDHAEPALVVTPRHRKRGFRPIVIALSAAFKYDSPKYCVRVAKEFLTPLNMTDCMSSTHALATLIHDHLLELLKMPLSPTTQIIVGEARILDGSGRARTVEILDHEPTQQL